jgi:hypothetical protein
LKMGSIGCPETSVRNYHYLLCNDPEEHVSHLLRDRSLKSHVILNIPQKLVMIRRLEPDEDLSMVIALYNMESWSVYGIKKWKDHVWLYNHVKLWRAFSSDIETV